MLLLLVGAAPVAATELQVFPLRLTLEPKAATGLLTIGNQGSNDTLLQIAVFDWKQADNEDKLTPTREILVNPPVFQLKAGSQQIARFGLRVPQLDVERSYRFTLQEVPQKADPNFMGLATLLKMSIPIFVPPAKPVVAMGWRVRTAPNGIQLVMANSGNVHVQLRKLKLVAGGKTLFDNAVNVYVLPGATRAIPIETLAPVAIGSSVQLDAETDQTPFSLAVPAEAGNGPGR